MLITVEQFLKKFKGYPKDATITFCVKEDVIPELDIELEEYCEFDSVERNRKDVVIRLKA